jgi:pimeloyl-ACP methyl ester carboxylesterase
MQLTWRCFLAFASLLLGTLAPCASADGMKPPGGLYDIGRYRLHLHCLGDGPYTVLFDSGLGGFSLEWLKVQRALAAEVRACAYDRAGYGWSDPGPAPRSTAQIVEELDLLLKTARLEPPYILVGHSFGGYNMQYFAKTHPRAVAGMVLVESSHPDQAERLPQVHIRELRPEQSRLITIFADPSMLEKYAEDVREQAGWLFSSNKAIYTQQRELANFSYSAVEVKQAGSLPPLPLVVLTRGRRVWPEEPLGNALEAEWLALQADLARMSPQARQIIAHGSGHLIHLDEPQIVVEAVREVLARACRLRLAETGC